LEEVRREIREMKNSGLSRNNDEEEEEEPIDPQKGKIYN
jgi:hypothetical protein